MHLILGDPTLRQLDLNYTDSQRGVLTPFRSSPPASPFAATGSC
jgi:hypothetical protein